MKHSSCWEPNDCLVTISHSHWSIMSRIIGPFYTNRDFFFLFIAAGREGTWRIDLQLLNGIPFIQSLMDLGGHVPSIMPDDFWSHLLTRSDQIISLLDTKSLSEICWNQDELFLSYNFQDFILSSSLDSLIIMCLRVDHFEFILLGSFWMHRFLSFTKFGKILALFLWIFFLSLSLIFPLWGLCLC